MRDNKLIGTCAGLTTLGSSLAIAFFLSPGFGPHLDSSPHEAVGRVLAQQTLALLRSGGRITAIVRDTATFENPATEVQFASFRQELAKARVKIDSIEALEVDPLRPIAVPASDFCQLLRNGTKGSVIVSFMGLPVLSDTQIAQLGEIRPSIVAFCSGSLRDQVDLPSLFARGLLHAAVVSKRKVGTARPTSEREVFDRQFIAVTPANLAALSTASNAPP